MNCILPEQIGETQKRGERAVLGMSLEPIRNNRVEGSRKCYGDQQQPHQAQQHPPRGIYIELRHLAAAVRTCLRMGIPHSTNLSRPKLMPALNASSAIPNITLFSYPNEHSFIHFFILPDCIVPIVMPDNFAAASYKLFGQRAIT